MKEYEQKERTENIASEPEVEYVTRATRRVPDLLFHGTEDILKNDLTEEEIDAELEDFFSEQRGLGGNDLIPEDCITIEEAYLEAMIHLKELYAKQKGHIKA